MRPTYVSAQQIGETLDHLQAAGRCGTECVVLWLGRDEKDGISAEQVYLPEQVAHADVFRIPPRSMRALLEALSSQHLMIAAQVHSHPFEAFHSAADDYWAIVRHVDALSLVLPNFALETSKSAFLANMKAFRLTATNRWLGLNAFEVGQWLTVR